MLASPEMALQGISMKSAEKAGPAKVGPEFLVAVHTKGAPVRSCPVLPQNALRFEERLSEADYPKGK